jgi:hypothetical protein
MDDESDLSIAAALLDDPTLNGHASSLDVPEDRRTGYVLFPAIDGASVYLGCQWTVVLIPARS